MARRALGSTRLGLLTTVASVVATAAILWPVAAYVIDSSSVTSPDPVTISDYSADFRVDEDGTLSAVETVTAQFPCCRHGIFRFWETKAPWDGSRLIPYDIEVTQDGQEATVELSWEKGRKYRVARIGEADRTLSPGQHVYEIRYTVKGALAPTSAGSTPGDSGSWASDGDSSVFYWNVVAGGWQMDIERATARVTLPTSTAEIKCTYGWRSEGVCNVTGGGTDGITISTGGLGPRTPVTVRATQSIPPGERVILPWAPQYDGVLGQSLPLAVVVLLLGALALLAGRLWEWRSREAPPGYPVTYEPPPGLGPVQTYYVMNERVPSDALISTLLYTSERGLTRLTRVEDGDWVIEGLGGDWSSVDEVTRAVGERLHLTQAGSSFSANGTVSAGEDLDAANSEIASATKAWATRSGLLAGHGTEITGRVFVVLAAIIAGVLVFTHPLGITLFAVPFAAFAVGGVGLLRTGVGTRRTTAGRDQWSRAGGFHRLLSTTSAQDRFDFSAHKELYTAYIPFAVAFACADKWAQKYQLSTGEQPPQPAWYVGPTPSHSSWGSSSSFAGFESSLRSSIGAYEASQSSSSSSGGGGFSGGGGGGGGGGGSW